MTRYLTYILKYLIAGICVFCLWANQAQALYFSAVNEPTSCKGISSSSSSNNSQQIPLDWVIAEIATEEDHDTNISKNSFRNYFSDQPSFRLFLRSIESNSMFLGEVTPVDQLRRPYFLLYHSWKLDFA